MILFGIAPCFTRHRQLRMVNWKTGRKIENAQQ